MGIAARMNNGLVAVALALSTAVFSLQAGAIAAGKSVENFRLNDHAGGSHELYRMSDRKAIAVLVQGNGCPIVRNAMPRFKELRDEFADQGVEFFLLNSNLQDNRANITKEVDGFAYDMPVLLDDSQLIGEALDLVRTGEVFVVDPSTWKVAYAGLVDDRLNYESQKESASEHYLRDALTAMVQGKAVQVAQTKPVGCLINFPEKKLAAQHAQISYSNDIAPMLEKNCVSCHREGGIGSWAMTEYNMIRGFAPMIREVVRTQRMPPWHADPHYGEFSNDRSLTVEERKTLVHWVEAGAPRGDGDDPLLKTKQDWPEWALGKPDVIIDITPHDVPATGTVPYQYQFVKNPLDKDVWVRAAEIIPGDRKALHHVITSFGNMNKKGRLDRRSRRGMGGYVPGAIAEEFPDGTGTFLPAGSTFMFQMHYTSYGKPATDKSRIGLYFHEAKPEHQLDNLILMNTDIEIPANSDGHTEMASQVLDRDMLLYSLLPHAHFRGKAMEFRAVYEDGKEEVLLSVPNYDFNWQTDYILDEPKLLPAGTKIVHTTAWDNTATNPANPDASRTVPWGQQSWDEMLFGSITLREVSAEEKVALLLKDDSSSSASAAGGGN